MTRVAFIGEAMIELSMQGTTAAVGVAGDTLNTAIYLKRAAPDVQVDYITRLGDDPFSGQIMDAMKAEDIGTDNIDIAAGETPGLYAITTDETGERSFTYWRSNAAARGLFSDGNFERLARYDLIYLSGISVAILPDPVRNSLHNALANHPALVAYDSNYRPRLWESVEAARYTNTQFWAISDIALPSIDDEMELFGETAAQVEARWTAFTGSGALKRGPSGPMSIGAPVEQTYPPAPKVIDTTAAGDSFNGGYLAARITGAIQPVALRAGHDLAATVVQHRGAIIPRQTG